MSEADFKRRALIDLLPRLEDPELRYPEERDMEEPVMFALGWQNNGHWWRHASRPNHNHDMKGWRPYWKFEDATKLASTHLGVIDVAVSIEDYADGGDILIPKSNHACVAVIRTQRAVFKAHGRSLTRALVNATIRGVLGVPDAKETFGAEGNPVMRFIRRFANRSPA